METLNIPQLEKHLVSLHTANESYKQVHSDIQDKFPEEVNMSEEEEVLSQHLDVFEDTESLVQLLLSTASSLNAPNLFGNKSRKSSA